MTSGANSDTAADNQQYTSTMVKPRLRMLARRSPSCSCSERMKIGLSALLKAMTPHLLALNLNGMTANGEKLGKKILPLGAGELDPKLLKAIAASEYRGPVGILGHTQDDAEERLADNLDGLAWLLPQLGGKPAGAAPKYRTYTPKP